MPGSDTSRSLPPLASLIYCLCLSMNCLRGRFIISSIDIVSILIPQILVMSGSLLPACVDPHRLQVLPHRGPRCAHSVADLLERQVLGLAESLHLAALVADGVGHGVSGKYDVRGRGVVILDLFVIILSNLNFSPPIIPLRLGRPSLTHEPLFVIPTCTQFAAL